ncbi:chorismate mutase [Kitasatospora sp. NPDC050543]|uniref:chorismate mutase n=1 Tax=Kitasatospora sp. NPDC050543 TaxID=3364054 RepID=UPI0037975BEF
MPDTARGGLAEHYGRIAELDNAIIDLVRERTRLLAGLQEHRRALRLPQVDLARENEMLLRYSRALGRQGADLALLLLDPR